MNRKRHLIFQYFQHFVNSFCREWNRQCVFRIFVFLSAWVLFVVYWFSFRVRQKCEREMESGAHWRLLFLETFLRRLICARHSVLCTWALFHHQIHRKCIPYVFSYRIPFNGFLPHPSISLFISIWFVCLFDEWLMYSIPWIVPLS